MGQEKCLSLVSQQFLQRDTINDCVSCNLSNTWKYWWCLIIVCWWYLQLSWRVVYFITFSWWC